MKNLTELNSQNKAELKSPIRITILFAVVLSLQSCGVHYVAQVPVATVQVRPAMPYAGAIWIDGEWGWSGGRHVMMPGYYAKPRNGKAYYAGEWRQTQRGHHYVHGGWR